MAVLLHPMLDAAYFHMRLFKPGTVVRLRGNRETISHIVVRRSLLLVHLVGFDSPVDADTLVLSPSRFTSVRVPL